jgi:hypothetical protein
MTRDYGNVPDPHLQEIDDPVYLLRQSEHYRKLASEIAAEARKNADEATMKKADQVARAARSARSRADDIIQRRPWWRAIVDRDLPQYLKKGIITSFFFALHGTIAR